MNIQNSIVVTRTINFEILISLHILPLNPKSLPFLESCVCVGSSEEAATNSNFEHCGRRLMAPITYATCDDPSDKGTERHRSGGNSTPHHHCNHQRSENLLTYRQISIPIFKVPPPEGNILFPLKM
ncbi:hypothetical protein AVEN_190027-1 [Araneus ventricosus]|uniref:Uncharacterized protein n=1 Tax=Araneus ventricosus TaxID=182803 RepID=A0A4Y2KVU9_ARAVE|nr:hypothetical protein AVEN_190027-1 [Araneus ventricosus]